MTAHTVVKRVARKHSDEGHSSAWKVAFADFCLALLCLFLVLWLMAAREQEYLQDLLKHAGGGLIDEGRGRLSESIGGPRGSLISREPMPSNGNQIAKRSLASGDDDPAGPGQGIRLSKTLYESRADMAELANVMKSLGEQVGLGANVHSTITPQGLRVMLHDTDKLGMFERGSAMPSERFRRLLQALGPVFHQIENQMVIVGHTDSVQYADRGPMAMSNWRLSSERAMTARSYLLAGGMPAQSVLQVVGLADGAPLNAKDPSANENRRIELLILTRDQSRSISAMFGAPGATTPLIDGVDTSVPDGATLDVLHQQLTSAVTATGR
jgi:chemotaxis protein MotB